MQAISVKVKRLFKSPLHFVVKESKVWICGRLSLKNLRFFSHPAEVSEQQKYFLWRRVHYAKRAIFARASQRLRYFASFL